MLQEMYRKKERHLRQWKNESSLRWDSNPRHSVLQIDALPTELPRQPSLANISYACINRLT